MASEEYGTSGHGAEVAVEADPVGAPDTYTVVGGLTSDVIKKVSRNYQESIPHSMGVDGGVVSNVIMRPTMTFENNYIPGNAVFDGIIREHFRLNREFKVRIRGFGGSADDDEQIHSGKVIDMEWRDPNEGPRVLAWEFRPIGEFKIDGVTYE